MHSLQSITKLVKILDSASEVSFPAGRLLFLKKNLHDDNLINALSILVQYSSKPNLPHAKRNIFKHVSFNAIMSILNNPSQRKLFYQQPSVVQRLLHYLTNPKVLGIPISKILTLPFDCISIKSILQERVEEVIAPASISSIEKTYTVVVRPIDYIYNDDYEIVGLVTVDRKGDKLDVRVGKRVAKKFHKGLIYDIELTWYGVVYKVSDVVKRWASDYNTCECCGLTSKPEWRDGICKRCKNKLVKATQYTIDNSFEVQWGGNFPLYFNKFKGVPERFSFDYLLYRIEHVGGYRFKYTRLKNPNIIKPIQLFLPLEELKDRPK